MFSKLKKITFVSVFFGSWSSFVLAINSPTTNVTEIYSYTEISDGDVIFKVSNEVAGCDGFWLDSLSPGHEDTLAILVSSCHVQSPIIVYAKQSEVFSESGQSFCKVTNLRLRSAG